MKVKIKYSIKRTINCQNYENIAIEYGEEHEVELTDKKSEYEQAREQIVEEIEKFIQEKEEEIREQLED